MTSSALASSLSLPLLRSRPSTHFYPVRWCALCTRSFLEEVGLKIRTYFSVFKGSEMARTSALCKWRDMIHTSHCICSKFINPWTGLKNGDVELWAKRSVSRQRQLLSWRHTHIRLDSITISSLLALGHSQASVMVMLHLFSAFRILPLSLSPPLLLFSF